MSESIRVTIRNSEQVEALLVRYPASLHEALNFACFDAADLILSESQKVVPVDTGTLKKSGSVAFGDLWAACGYNTPYAAVVEYGYPAQTVNVRSHLREVKTFFGKAMEGVSVVVRAHKRDLTARAGVYYLQHAIDYAKTFIPQLFRRRIREAYEAMKGGK